MRIICPVITVGLLFFTIIPSNSQPVDDYQILWQCSGASATSEFGAYLVSAGDQNLDGYDDILITALNEHEVYLYYGGSSMDTVPDLVFGPYPPYEPNGFLPKECHDLNADGYPDIAIGAISLDPFQRCVFLYFGGPELDNQYDLLFMPGPPGTSHGYFGEYMSMGDINGDGNYDLVVGAPTWYQGGTSGKIFIYYGGADMDTTADFTITGTSATVRHLGGMLSCGGDVNNDGYDDILTSGVQPGYSEGIALYYGGSSPDSIHDWIYQIPYGSFDDFGQNIIPDINNDGYGEIVYGSIGGGDALLYYGSNNISSNYDVRLQGGNFVNYTQGSNYIGDLNNDGYADYATGSYVEECIFVFFLSPYMGNIKSYDLLIQGEGIGSYAASFAGDINNDGVTELMYRSHAPEIDRGTVFMYGNPDLAVNNPPASIPPSTFALHPCYPNPFNSSTTISFTINKALLAKLTIYNQLGQVVLDLGFRTWDLGVNKVIWDAEGLSSGIYMVELEQEREKRTVKAQLIK